MGQLSHAEESDAQGGKSRLICHRCSLQCRLAGFGGNNAARYCVSVERKTSSCGDGTVEEDRDAYRAHLQSTNWRVRPSRKHSFLRRRRPRSMIRHRRSRRNGNDVISRYIVRVTTLLYCGSFHDRMVSSRLYGVYQC